jgi:putative glutamate/gamma-aminobutyrate antiporter
MPASQLRRSAHHVVRHPHDPDTSASRGPRVLGAGSIALISLAAVLSLRGMPSVAEYGWASIAFYLLGALLFFVPLALVAAELATGWPRAGGLYLWVKEAFGDRAGFLAVWFEWVENIVWFPTVLSFVAATLAYVIDPGLANNKLYLVIAMLTIFWALTLANFFGMKWTARLNNVGVVAGTIFPAIVLIALGAYWLLAGRHSAIPFSPSKLVPNFSHAGNLVFFAGVLLGYAGIEMAGFHAKETRDPSRDYPKAIFLAAGLIVLISILGTLAIAFVVPQAKLSLVSGLLQAFSFFFSSLGIGAWATKVMAALVGLGTLALISTWLLGPAKGLYASETTGDVPPELQYVNKRHVPVAILIAQGGLASLFALLFLFVPSINTSYWMLSALTTQILVLMYILVFAAVLRLRYTQPDVARPYKVPGGKIGIWIVAGLGLAGSTFGLVIGFIPPSGIPHWPTPIYVGAMFLAIIICSAPPFIIEAIKKPGWKSAHPDDVLLDVPDAPAGTPIGTPAGLALMRGQTAPTTTIEAL